MVRLPKQSGLMGGFVSGKAGAVGNGIANHDLVRGAG
jgi:hypothetical protein